MEFTGKIQNISTDWQSGLYHVTFSVNEPFAINDIARIQDCEKLSIKADKYKNKRSLDANSYCWALMTKIAEAISTVESVISKDEVYEEMLQKYGCLYQDDEGYITMTVKANVDMSKIGGHWKFVKTNGSFSSYLLIKGSSEYNTAEMARFIDAVVYEAQNLGIETIPPDKLERMKATWQNA